MEYEVQSELTKYAQKVVQKGLVVGPGGNISARQDNLMFISPSGFDLADIKPDQWVVVEIDSGKILNGDLRPSSEVLMHLACYQIRDDINAVVHTHPPYCIALSTVSDELPTLFPDQSALVGTVQFVPYVLPTTLRLAEAVKAQIANTSSLILKNHGLVTIGKNLREAYYRAEVVEESAKIFLLASSVREPKRMTEEEVAEIQMLESESYRIKLLQDQS